MRRKILSLLVGVGLAMSVSMPSFAAPLTEQLNNQNKQLLEQQDSYTKVQKNFEKLNTSIEMLDSNIESMYSGIDKAKNEINDTEKKIVKSKKDIVIAEHNIKGEETLFNERMRVMFMNGADSYLEILLDSEGLEDLVSRVENVKKIVEYDNKIIKELNDKKQNIENRKKVLNDNKIKVLALKADNEQKLDKLAVQKKDQKLLIVEATKQQDLHKNEIAATKASLGSTKNQIKEAANQKAKSDVAMATEKTPSITPSRGGTGSVANDEPKEEVSQPSRPSRPSSGNSSDIVAYAESFMGTPYAWGATGPNTFDCSGFTQYVYAHFGISTGRTTYDQIANGSYVSRGNLQPGDLVFFGSGSPHHVGMYVGNNSYIHAPQTGDVVKVSQLTRGDYMSARRYR